MKVSERVVTNHVKRVCRTETPIGEKECVIYTTKKEIQTLAKDCDNWPEGCIGRSHVIEGGVLTIMVSDE